VFAIDICSWAHLKPEGKSADEVSMRALLVGVSAAFCLTLVGCGDGEFNPAKALAAGPRQLDGEQVVLTQAQLECGATEELWNMETQGDRSSGRLTAKGQALGFSDDIRVNEQRNPYVQIRGSFPLSVSGIAAVRDEDPQTKVVEAKVGVVVDHACFHAPLPMMGIRKGNFAQTAPARFQFALRSDYWEYERLLH
jgi:hypothetical protein